MPRSSAGVVDAGLGSTEGLCQSTMVLNQQSLEPSMLPASRIGISGASVEGYPMLLKMLWDFPRLICNPSLRSDSGIQMETAFQRRLLSSCCNHGDPSQPNLTTHNFKSGLCDVLKRIANPTYL